MIAIENLNIKFKEKLNRLPVIRNISFQLDKGEILGVVGESGCGKSLTNFALMGLLPSNAIVTADRLSVAGNDLLTFSKKDWNKFRGTQAAMIFQDPMSALNPSLSIENQMLEVIFKTTSAIKRKDARTRAIDLLEQVGIPAPEKRIKGYAHELSGGMAQRIMIAMALANKPKLLIADEPTTALDVIMQKQILDLLVSLRDSYQMTIILVSHDIGVIKNYSERIQVMYSGEIVETGSTRDVISNPRHPYTQGLLMSLPGNIDHPPKTPLPTIRGNVIPISKELDGCRFRDRCDRAKNICGRAPDLRVISNSHQTRKVKCHL